MLSAANDMLSAARSTTASQPPPLPPSTLPPRASDPLQRAQEMDTRGV